jgi:hypothetical protein
MIEVRGFTGKLNLDDNDYRVPKDDYVDALNITRDAQGHGQDLVLSNIPGNQTTLGLYTTVNQTASGQAQVGLYGTTTASTTIECYIYDIGSSSNVLVSSVTIPANTYSFNIAAQLYSSAITISGVTYSYGETGFYLFYNGASYTAPSLKVNGVFIGYGYNKVIGSYADKIKNRIYYFIWNEGNHDKIMYYDETINTIFTLMENIKDTGGVDILNFNPSYRINHIDIVYREGGDLLFWTDGLNAPRKINVQKAITGGYGVILNSYIDVAKEPPSTPPQCVYEDNVGIVINNLQEKQFKFKYRFVFDDLEKSVTSAQSEVPIPKDYTLQSNISDASKNSSIFLTLETGPKNVTAIEVLGAESLGVNYSDFFLITVLNKAQLNIPNNDFIGYKFFNDQAYNTIPLDESIQPFDNVPQQAYTQSLPNGNVLTYGAITEGYNLIKPDYNASINGTYPYWFGVRTHQTALIFTNDTINYIGIHGNNTAVQLIVAGTPTIGDEYSFEVLLNGVYTYIFYTAAVATAADVIAGLKADATSKGLSSITLPNGYTLFYVATGTVTRWLPPRSFPASAAVNENSYLAYDWSSRYSFGVVYFDEKGRTNGVITSDTSVIQTREYNPDGIPRIDFTINSLPPSWAKYFEIVRTKNLSKSNFLYWVSSGTFIDIKLDPLGYQYAYISLNSLYQYIENNPSLKTLGYEFTKGDRIRFCALYDDNSGGLIRTYNDKDFEILDTVTTPPTDPFATTTAPASNGLYIKIALPATDPLNFDFGVGFLNYMVQLYTPAPNFSNNDNLYYEFGEKYEIGNPGTQNAYHKGFLQNQTVVSGTSTNPALYLFYKGDNYFRTRRYNKGGKATWTIPQQDCTHNDAAATTLVSNSFSDPRFICQSSQAHPLGSGPFYPLCTFVKFTGSYIINFRIKGKFKIYNPSTGGLTRSGMKLHDVGVADIFDNYGITYLNDGESFEFSIDVPFTTQLATYAFTYDFYYAISTAEFSLEFDLNTSNPIIDPNFSDTYDSSASVNGRAWRIDANAENSFNPGLVRFGGEFQAGTTINNINRFYEPDFDVYDRSRGDIKKMFIEGRKLYVFQQFDVGVVTVLTQIVKDTAGNPLSAQSNTLLNKIVYPYIGGYGIGNVPESFAFGKHSKYFVDNNKGVVCRLAENGITPLSIVYKTNAYFVAQLAAYNEKANAIPPITGRPTVYGGFDAYTNKYIIALEEVRGQYGNLIQDASTLCFLETNGPSEGFETFLSYHPEAINGLNNLLVTFKNGAIWTHNNYTYNRFYTDVFSSSISVVFNDSQLDKKTYLSLMQTANEAWSVPSIVSQLNSHGSTPQETALVAERFSLLEGQYSSAILRDINSPGGLINGDTIHGNYIIVKLEKYLATNFYYINTVSLKYINSPLNLR